MSKKMCIVLVCYNAYEDAQKLLFSIDSAYSKVKGLELTVVFSDNSTRVDFNIDALCDYSFDFFYIKNENIGYFPAFKCGVNAVSYLKKDFDYIAISNVDLIMADDFFCNLMSLPELEGVGVLAPRILSVNHGNDSNPKILQRPKKIKFLVLRTIFSNVFLYCLYNYMSRIKAAVKSNDTVVNSKLNRKCFGSIDMYAPHGAFMIFHRNYIHSNASFGYPRMLFGEEVFVGEECLRNDLRVTYADNLIIYDAEHGSTSLEKDKFISGEHVKSYDYLLNTYFKN